MSISCRVNGRPIIRSVCRINSWRDSSKFISAKGFCSVPVCFLSVIKLRLRRDDDISRSCLAKTSTLGVCRTCSSIVPWTGTYFACPSSNQSKQACCFVEAHNSAPGKRLASSLLNQSPRYRSHTSVLSFGNCGASIKMAGPVSEAACGGSCSACSPNA
jgi:hypothetical protein